MLAIFDTEGVLVDGEFMPHVARLSDKEKEVSEITNQGITGEIDWVTGLHKRIEFLKGISYDDCCSIANESNYDVTKVRYYHDKEYYDPHTDKGFQFLESLKV